MKLSLSILICISTLLLSACDPRFKTTSEQCAINQAVRVTFRDFNIKASDDEYQPYLQDMLTALQVTDDPIPAEQQLALTKIDEILKEFMPYETIDDEFVFTNSLDMLEAILSTTDPATVIEIDDEGKERNISNLIDAFESAKKQVADGIEADNGSCRYTNSNIIIENFVSKEPDPITNVIPIAFKNILEVQLRMTYDPFRDTFVQAIVLGQLENDPDEPNNAPIDLFNPSDSLKTIQTSYAGGFNALPSDFKAVGYTPTSYREAQITPGNQESAMEISYQDSLETDKLDTVEYSTIDSFCTLKNERDETAFLDSNTFALSGNTLTINDKDQIVIDDKTLIINKKKRTINKIINNGEVLEVANNTFTITDQTVVLDKNTLLINSSEPMIVSETNTTFAVIDCADDVITIEPVKDQCDGGLDSDGEPQTDERNHREVRTFDLNTEHTDIKRLRIETDYPENEIRVYVSKYKERILDADETQDPETSIALDDPSRCEKQAILDELALLTPGEGVSLTLVPDPGYDFVFIEDDEGDFVLDEDNLPEPAYRLTGTAIPARQ